MGDLNDHQTNRFDAIMSMAVNEEQNLLMGADAHSRNSMEHDFPSLPGSLSSYDAPNPLLIAAAEQTDQVGEVDDTPFYVNSSQDDPARFRSDAGIALES